MGMIFLLHNTKEHGLGMFENKGSRYIFEAGKESNGKTNQDVK
jgi:hypothetical protein